MTEKPKAELAPPLVSASERAHARWVKVSPKKRAEFMKRIRAQRKRGTGDMGAARRSRKRRCPCQAMTLKRAKARGRTWEHEAGCSFHPETAVTVSADKSDRKGNKTVAETRQGMPNRRQEKAK